MLVLPDFFPQLTTSQAAYTVHTITVQIKSGDVAKWAGHTGWKTGQNRLAGPQMLFFIDLRGFMQSNTHWMTLKQFPFSSIFLAYPV